MKIIKKKIVAFLKSATKHAKSILNEKCDKLFGIYVLQGLDKDSRLIGGYGLTAQEVSIEFLIICVRDILDLILRACKNDPVVFSLVMMMALRELMEDRGITDEGIDLSEMFT